MIQVTVILITDLYVFSQSLHLWYRIRLRLTYTGALPPQSGHLLLCVAYAKGSQRLPGRRPAIRRAFFFDLHLTICRHGSANRLSSALLF